MRNKWADPTIPPSQPTPTLIPAYSPCPRAPYLPTRAPTPTPTQMTTHTRASCQDTSVHSKLFATISFDPKDAATATTLGVVAPTMSTHPSSGRSSWRVPFTGPTPTTERYCPRPDPLITSIWRGVIDRLRCVRCVACGNCGSHTRIIIRAKTTYCRADHRLCNPNQPLERDFVSV